jgi:hypothetical protein
MMTAISRVVRLHSSNWPSASRSSMIWRTTAYTFFSRWFLNGPRSGFYRINNHKDLLLPRFWGFGSGIRKSSSCGFDSGFDSSALSWKYSISRVPWCCSIRSITISGIPALCAYRFSVSYMNPRSHRRFRLDSIRHGNSFRRTGFPTKNFGFSSFPTSW